MMYRQFLAMRKGLLLFIAIIVGIAAAGLAVQVSQGHHTGQPSFQEIMISSAWPVSVFAAIFGIGLPNASRGPARVVWVLPIARWKLALQSLAVDALGITIAFVATCCIMLMCFVLLGAFAPWSIPGRVDWSTPFVALAFLFAVYGWGAVVGMLLRRVAFRAVSFPLLLFWMMFGQMRGVFGDILRAPIALNPFAVLSNVNSGVEIRVAGGNLIGASLAWMDGGWELPVLLGTALVLCAITVVMWQRAEVLPA